MLKINFSSAISIYLCFSIFLVFTFWIFYNFRRNGILNETRYLQQCPYCTYIFFNYTAEEATPRTKETEGEEKGDGHSSKTLPQTGAGRTPDEKKHVLVCPRCQSYINQENTSEEG